MYFWKILSLTKKPLGGVEDFVCRVDFEYCLIRDGQCVSTVSSLSFTQPDGSVVPFDALTEQIVSGWLESHPMLETFKFTLECKMNALKDISHQPGSEQTVAPPWATQEQEA